MAYTRTGAQTALQNLVNTASYLGFSTTTPTDAGGNITEPSSSAGYSRIHLATSGSGAGIFIVSASGHSLTNSEIIYAPEPTSNWGTLTHFVLFTAASGGNAYYYGELKNTSSTVGVTVNTGSIFFIRQGELEITLDDPT